YVSVGVYRTHQVLFSSRRRHTRFSRDWSSDVCSSDLIKLGLDGIIVSNHGGRQLDAGESTIRPLSRIAAKYGDQIKVMMDSGLRSEERRVGKEWRYRSWPKR